MKPTINQLNALSDYEINCAVAEKLNLPDIKIYPKSILVSVNDGENLNDYDPCTDPRDYIAIAIEHNISILFNVFRDKVKCSWSDPKASYAVPYMPKAELGRAVCISFLLMNGESK